MKEEERAASFAADAKELSAQLEILEKGTAGRPWIAGANFRSPIFASDPSSIAAELSRHAAGAPERQSLARQDRGPGRLPEIEILSRAHAVAG